MKTFRITYKDKVDYVKAKHIKDGDYFCKRIKTGNKLGVKWIGTYNNGYSIYYMVVDYYKNSPLAYDAIHRNNEIKVNMVD